MKIWLFHTMLLTGVSLLLNRPAESGTLQVGAAKVDITPPANAELPMSGYAGRLEGFKRIHDHIYARIIVLSDGERMAALVAWELIGVPDAIWEELSQRIPREAGIPVEYLLLTAVHDHAAPSPFGMYGNNSPKSAAYTKQVEDATVAAVHSAKENLQPAKIGMGTGRAYVNINRREYSPENGWWLGYNPEGPSDKTVTVIRFETMSGKPIAFIINYAVHAVVMGDENYEISGDLAGATSRYVENYYRNRVEDAPRDDAGAVIRPRAEQTTDRTVAMWTSGAAGDQNPVSLARGSDFTMVDALGKILGEEAVRVAATIHTTDQVRIWGRQQAFACPGRKLEAGPVPRRDYKWDDADPIHIRLSLLMINDVALAGVSGEVMTMIHEHLKKQSDSIRTVMVTHTNGSSGYIPDDAAFAQVSYEITTSPLQPGCAENKIISGFLGLIEQRQRSDTDTSLSD